MIFQITAARKSPARTKDILDQG